MNAFIKTFIQPQAWCITGPVFKWGEAGWNLEFSTSLTSYDNQSRELSLHYYLLKTGRRDGFMPFPKTLAWNKREKDLAGVELVLPNPFSYDDNRLAHLECNIKH